jgi:hypothetical protein
VETRTSGSAGGHGETDPGQPEHRARVRPNCTGGRGIPRRQAPGAAVDRDGVLAEWWDGGRVVAVDCAGRVMSGRRRRGGGAVQRCRPVLQRRCLHREHDQLAAGAAISGATGKSLSLTTTAWMIPRRSPGASGSGRPVPAPSTRPGSSPPVARSNRLTFVVISGIHSIPALGSVIIQRAGASPEVAREGEPPSYNERPAAGLIHGSGTPGSFERIGSGTLWVPHTRSHHATRTRVRGRRVGRVVTVARSPRRPVGARTRAWAADQR